MCKDLFFLNGYVTYFAHRLIHTQRLTFFVQQVLVRLQRKSLKINGSVDVNIECIDLL